MQDPSPRMERCALEMCIREVDLNDEKGVVECAICEWLDRKGGREHERQGRFYYCSIEHAEDDFDDHDRDEHSCCMSRRCFYFPQSGPPGEMGGGGICQDCADYDEVSYFCSQNCYHHNLDIHREDVHMGRGIHSGSEHLELFRPAEDMEIVS